MFHFKLQNTDKTLPSPLDQPPPCSNTLIAPTSSSTSFTSSNCQLLIGIFVYYLSVFGVAEGFYSLLNNIIKEHNSEWI
ncbi:hypothetical protein QVD17_39608 [Tagetes erecta]|uniref:Uncharacterized protein n=1 Tax=Tagetes erecta TaxID=13708 RepID=A0AAD8JUE1_TARER|nr:hypothetical protein QVD17_39608 [Tagetes erecta]